MTMNSISIQIFVIFFAIFHACAKKSDSDSEVSQNTSKSSAIKVKIKNPTYLKKSAESSASLSDSEKCKIPVGNEQFEIIGVPTSVGTDHFKIMFKNTPVSSEGICPNPAHVFGEHVAFIGWKSPELVYPVRNGSKEPTSHWCELRNFGTSPHIGVDIWSEDAWKMRFLSLTSGKVELYREIHPCGHEIRIRDLNGALWRYVHVGNSKVSQGEKVWPGKDLSGFNAVTEGEGMCASGPHLHLQLLEKGTYKTESSQFSECNFNPWTIVRTLPILSAPRPEPILSNDTLPANSAGGPEVPASQNDASQPVTSAQASRKCTNIIKEVQKEEVETPTTDENIVHELFALGESEDSGFDYFSTTNLVRNGDSVNNKNLCINDNCITSLDIYVTMNDSTWNLVYSNQGLRNIEPSVRKEGKLCMPAGSKNYAMRIQTKDKVIRTVSGKIKPGNK